MTNSRSRQNATDHKGHPIKEDVHEVEEKLPPSANPATNEAIIELARLKSNDPKLTTININYKLLQDGELSQDLKKEFFSALAKNNTVVSLGLKYLDLSETDLFDLSKALSERKIELKNLFLNGNIITPAGAKVLSICPIKALSLALTQINDEAAMAFVESKAKVEIVDFSSGQITVQGLLKIIDKNKETQKLNKDSIESALNGLYCTDEQTKFLRTKINEMVEKKTDNNLNLKK
jgi:hypothetical protein